MGGLFDRAGREAELAKLEDRAADPGLWADQEGAQKLLRRIAEGRAPLERLDNLIRRHGDLAILRELGQEENDAQVREEVEEGWRELTREAERLEMGVVFRGKYDRGNAILALHAGAGGTDAQDWVESLARMYNRWAGSHGFQAETLDLLEGDEAGLKSITIQVTGENAYGYLKAERGVHRLVRISPFDASGRRHTSFASVDCLPQMEEDDAEVTINPEDLRIDPFRAGGAGGQHVNKTESAVRIVHLPTNTVVTCQKERSQHSNRDTAMGILRAKLTELKLEEEEREIQNIRGDQGEIAWGNQIRSYVFQPYSLVKDHRTGVELGNVQGVMDGELDPLILAWLQWSASAAGGRG